MPERLWKNTPLTRVPAPAVPCDALPGLALSQAISSVRLLAGTVFLATTSCGLLVSSAIGSRSSSRL